MSDNNVNNAAPMAQNEYVSELLAILESNGRDTSGLTALLGHVSEMESFVKRAEDTISNMKSQLAEMKEVQNHPVKTVLQNAIKALEKTVVQVKAQLAELKHNIVQGCKSAVQSFRENGEAALNNLVKFFRVKDCLRSLGKSADESAARCDKAIDAIGKFADNYHITGLAVKNMGRILTGKEPLSERTETGRLAAAIAAPYKVQKALQQGIKAAAAKAITALDNAEEQQAAKAQTRAKAKTKVKKPSLLGRLDEGKTIAAALNRENANRDRTLAKGAEI